MIGENLEKNTKLEGIKEKEVDKKIFSKKITTELFSSCMKAIDIQLNMGQINNAIIQFNSC